MKSNKNLLFFLLLIFVLGLILFLNIYTKPNIKIQNGEKLNDKNDKYVRELQEFNNIIYGATSIGDVEKCSILDYENLKTSCKEQISFNFDEMNIAKDSNDCEKLTDKNGLKKEFRRDICYLNLNYRFATNSGAIKQWCGQIKTENIKELCIEQNRNKFKK